MPRATRRSRSVLLATAATATTLLAAGCEREPEPLPRGDDVSLVVLVVIDQARGDYLERFRPLLDGGLARLFDEGVVFTDGHQEHAMTATAPGHAAISTGLEPGRSGIVGNSWVDSETGLSVYSSGSSDSPSPVYLGATALGDWLKTQDPRSKVFSASAKDRSAVMLGGQNPDGVFWYDRWMGTWRSSEYYLGEGPGPAWLSELNERRWLDSFFGTVWAPLIDRWDLDLAAYGVRPLDTGQMVLGPPYALGGLELQPSGSFYNSIYATPFIDAYLLELARTIVREESLGADGSVDLLALSFSGLDSVGHDHGPDSPEVLDTILRLDELLGELLAFLEDEVGREHLLLALSSDHGVQRLPEIEASEGSESFAGRRVGADDVACVQAVGKELQRQYGGEDWAVSGGGGMYLLEDRLAALGVDPAEVEVVAARLLEECDAVRRVWTNEELAADRNDDPAFARFKRNHFPPRSPDLTLQLEPFHLDDAMGTTHGSVYDYDSHVPILFWGAGLGPARIDERAATVDIAPTLARLIGVETPSGLDGQDRSERLSATPPEWAPNSGS